MVRVFDADKVTLILDGQKIELTGIVTLETPPIFLGRDAFTMPTTTKLMMHVVKWTDLEEFENEEDV